MKKIKNLAFVSLSIFIMMMASSCLMIAGEIPLDTPKNLRVVSVSHDSAVIAWDKVSHSMDYEVSGENISTGEPGFIYFPDEPRIEINNLDWDETYQVTINARASGTIWDKYTRSDTAKITFKTTIPGVSAGELARPLNLKSVYEDGKVKFSWDEVSGADFYEVYCEYFTLYNGWDFHCSERHEPATKNYLIDDRLPEGISKICYRVCARSNANPEMRNWSKKNFIRFKNK